MHWAELVCPWCWESQSVPLEADLEGSHVVDCQICCRPWRVEVSWLFGEAEPVVQVDRA